MSRATYKNRMNKREENYIQVSKSYGTAFMYEGHQEHVLVVTLVALRPLGRQLCM